MALKWLFLKGFKNTFLPLFMNLNYESGKLQKSNILIVLLVYKICNDINQPKFKKMINSYVI